MAGLLEGIEETHHYNQQDLSGDMAALEVGHE
jgi:hypothetical protein